jgi:DNA-binding CsgD family transcriptional regulator/PAS domain-containing protein
MLMYQSLHAMRRGDAVGKRPDFDEVIISLYEAATDAALWRPALSAVASLFEPYFAGHTFIWDSARSVGFSDVDRKELAAANEDYARYYNKIDPRAAMIAAGSLGRAYACHHYFDDGYVARSEFYQDFMIKIGGRYIAAMKLAEGDAHSAFISIHRSTRQGPFEAADLKLLQRLQPHLSQAATLFHKFADLRATKERTVAALERLPWGVLIVSGDGKILDMNGAAEAHLKAGKVIKSNRGRIETAYAEQASALHRMIADAAGAAVGKLCKPGGLLRMERPSGKGYVDILIAPLRQAKSDITQAATSAAILFIADSENQPIIPATWLQQLYGLTPAEAVVALALASGKTIGQIAEMNGVTKNTVRVQTQRILEKTGVGRQAELVALLSRMPLIRS